MLYLYRVLNNEWRESMKDNILLFIIGVLVGAVIATGAFFAYTKANSTCNNGMPGGNPPSMPNGQMPGPGMQNGQMGQPPARPGENNSQTNNN